MRSAYLPFELRTRWIPSSYELTKFSGWDDMYFHIWAYKSIGDFCERKKEEEKTTKNKVKLQHTNTRTHRANAINGMDEFKLKWKIIRAKQS